mgnify:CR=1 FL=1
MSISAKYLFIVSMDVAPSKESLFNEVYDEEHVPSLMKVPGVLSVTRTTAQPLTMSLGGELREMIAEGEPKHTAIYEIESPAVLESEEWGIAVDAGRWPEEVRPHTSNRQFALRKQMG